MHLEQHNAVEVVMLIDGDYVVLGVKKNHNSTLISVLKRSKHIMKVWMV